MPSDREWFVVHPRSTFSAGRQLATPQNAQVQKRQNLEFSAAQVQQNKPIIIKTKFGA